MGETLWNGGAIDWHKLSWLRGRNRRIASAEPHLLPDEQVVAAFSTHTMSGLWVVPAAVVGTQAVLGFNGMPAWLRAVIIALCICALAAYLVRNQNRVVIATNRRTLVGPAGALITSKMRSLEQVLPPDIRIGPPNGFIESKTDALGSKMRFHRSYDGEVELADSRRFSLTPVDD